jgi:hypothetical protein
LRGELGDWLGQAASLINKGTVLLHRGHYQSAVESMEKALTLRLQHCGDLVSRN